MRSFGRERSAQPTMARLRRSRMLDATRKEVMNRAHGDAPDERAH
jgi:hypothetical protein